MNTWLIGAIAGAVATAPMTLAMKLIHLSLPRPQRNEPMPPRQVTMRAAEAAGVDGEMNEPARDAATAISHVSYGATAGAAYVAAAHRLPGGPVTRGAIFGLGVWAGSYLGWLPAARVLPPATRWPVGRNVMMIVSHVVWGAATGIVADVLMRRQLAR